MKKKSISFCVVIHLVLILNRVQSQLLYNETSARMTSVQNYENLTRMEDILELFSVDIIGAQWENIYEKIQNKQCAKDMTEYLNGLSKRKIWAMKSKYGDH